METYQTRDAWMLPMWTCFALQPNVQETQKQQNTCQTNLQLCIHSKQTLGTHMFSIRQRATIQEKMWQHSPTDAIEFNK